MKKFEQLEQFRNQEDATLKTRARYEEKVEAAKQALTNASKALDEILHIEVARGTDKSAEKTAARKKIAVAELAVQHAEEEKAKAIEYLNGQPGGIHTPASIVHAYLFEYKQAVRADHLPDIQKRMQEGQALILQALYDYKQLKFEYEPLVNEIKSLNDAATRQGGTSYSITNPFGELADSGFNTYELQDALQTVNNGGQIPTKFKGEK